MENLSGNSMNFAVVTSLLRIVEQQVLLEPHRSLIFPDDDDIRIVQLLSLKLSLLQDYLAHEWKSIVPKKKKKHQIRIRKTTYVPKVKSLGERIRNVVVEAEYQIESILSDICLADNNGESTVEACHELQQTLKQLVRSLVSLEERIRRSVVVPSSLSDHEYDGSVSSLNDLRFEDAMIGIEDEFQKIKDTLLSPSRFREVISIVGMGGSGKTTLAQRVSLDRDIVCHFGIEGTYDMFYSPSSEIGVLEDILDAFKISIPVGWTNDRQEEQLFLENLLHQTLKGQRYLLVVDNISELQAWDLMNRYLLEDFNGSRILIITRIQQVAEYASSSEHIYHTRSLSPNESMNLLATKVFDGKCFLPPEFKSMGRKIAEKCRGLPLATALVAGLLAHLDKSPEQWKDVAENIYYLQRKFRDPVSAILELSYNFLPRHLRVCFLYFSVFPRDSIIHVRKLMKLWVAEGFLKHYAGKSLEEVAEHFMCEFIVRSLVQVVKRAFDGKVKTCRLISLVHDFCSYKAQVEEKTLVVRHENCDLDSITWSEGGEQSLPAYRWMSCLPDPWPVNGSRSSIDSLNEIRSLLYLHEDLYLAKCRYIFPCFKLLRVFDMSSVKYWQGMPSGIEHLIHLRYLALTTAGSLRDFRLFKLQNLQTLDLFSWVEECPLQLPCNILGSPLLRHVRLDKGSSLHLPNVVRENLQTLFWLKISSWDSETPDFTKVPNLKELGIYIGGEVSAEALSGLVVLHQLEKLKFEMGRVESFNLPTAFPPNLKKLTLSKTYLPWEKMDVIGELPKLEVLKLNDFAFCGVEWKPKARGFQKLKFLLIAHSDLEHWHSNECLFPVLERLFLRKCRYLEELPIDIAYISTLRLVELIDCCSKIVTSAKDIEKTARGMGISVLVRLSLTEDKFPNNESSGGASESLQLRVESSNEEAESLQFHAESSEEERQGAENFILRTPWKRRRARDSIVRVLLVKARKKRQMFRKITLRARKDRDGSQSSIPSWDRHITPGNTSIEETESSEFHGESSEEEIEFSN